MQKLSSAALAVRSVAIALLMVIATFQNLHAQQAGTEPGLEPVTLATDGGFVVINAEVARTSKEKEKGLMNRDSLPEGRGMLFIWDKPGPVTMWMKDTRIPLDMIFILPSGIVHRIVENTEPYSEQFISSHGNVLAVLEVRAGITRKAGLKAGNKVHHSVFDKAKAE